MPCTNCNQTTATISGFIPANCSDTSNPCFTDASCIYYTGPNLTCSTITTNDSLDVILQKIDPLLCAATGNYSEYNTYCLAPIATQQQFVESISQFVCDTRTDLDTFIDTTFPAYQTAVDTRFDALEVPGITCASASVISTDTLQQVLTKYCTKFASIDTLLNVSSADWSQCYVVSPAPTTPTQGFDVLIDQICLLKTAVESGTASLPTFNNVGSCLPAPLTATDTLVDTVNKIKTRLCQTGTVDTTTLSWGCVTQPTGAQNLQDSLQNILTRIQAIAQTLPTVFDAGDFTVTNVDNGNLCLGKNVALATPSTQDRFVASTALDLSPGTLQAKVTAGTNITLDFVTTPGQMIINSTAVASSNYQVKINSGDTTPGYLADKIVGGAMSCGLQVIASSDLTNEQIVLNISLDPVDLFQCLIDALSEEPTLKDSLCAAIATCPSPCDAPSNVVVTYEQGTTTTTTTTTTSTTTTTTTTL
jgi:hypothetical protein